MQTRSSRAMHCASAALLAILAITPLACTSIHVIGGNDPRCLDSASEEVCDGIDNDCNGIVDDGVPGTDIPCSTGLGQTCEDGFTACVVGEISCVAANSSEEVCDGIDNDCDGQIDESGSWASYDDGMRGGLMGDVVFDPRNPGVAYAIAGSHAYRSSDSGESFTLVGKAPHWLRQLVFPPNQPDLILAASDGGVLESSDDGASWSARSLDGLPLFSMFLHPADPARIFVGTTGGGIYRSTNGGSSFTPVNEGVALSRVAQFAGDPNDADVVVATIQLLTPQGVTSDEGKILHTTNGGDNWSIALDSVGLASGITQCSSDAKHLFAGIWNDGLAESVDGGASWTVRSLGGLPGWDVEYAPGDCSRIYATVFPDGVMKSDNAGLSFAPPSAQGMDVQYPGQVKLAVDPTDRDRVLASNHSGVFLTTTGGNSWTRVPGITGSSVRALAVRPSEPAKLWMSTWGQGIWTRESPQADWSKLDSAALPRDWSFTIAPDPNDLDRVLVGAWNDLWTSTDGGSTFANTGVNTNVLSIAYHPNDSQIVYVATQLGGVQRSLDGGMTFTPHNAGLPQAWPSGPCVCQHVRDVLVDPDEPNTVYIATVGKGIFRSVNGGAWQAVAPQLADEATGCLTKRAGQLYACVEGEGIWTSSDNGDTFTPLTQGVGELSNVTALLHDTATGDLYATSDGGVFRSTDGANWEGMQNECLPTLDLSAPAIVDDGNERLLVFAAASGGLLSVPLP